MERMKVLFIEDNLGDARLVKEMCKEVRIEIVLHHVRTLEEGISTLDMDHFDAILLDLGLPDSVGFPTLEKMKEHTNLPIILLTGLHDETVAINALKRGAQDYLMKGKINSDLLVRSLCYSIERDLLIKKLKSASLKDDLTNLYNRRGFFELAEKQTRIADRTKNGFLLIYCDLNDLKVINDQLGHEYGDKALLDTARIFKEAFRESDIIARIGGDEFVVVALNSSEESIQTVKERFWENVELVNRTENNPYILEISIGIVAYDPTNPCKIEELLSKADQLMYQNKLEMKAKKRNELV